MKLTTIKTNENQITGQISRINFVFTDSEGVSKPKTVNNGDKNFTKMLNEVQKFADGLITLEDMTLYAGRYFDLFNHLKFVFKDKIEMSTRITMTENNVLIDGEPVEDSLANQLIKMSETKDEDDRNWNAFVNFVEKLYSGPSKDVRDQLFRWLMREFTKTGYLTLTPDGDFIGYKGYKFADDRTDLAPHQREIESVHSGTAFVNGEEIKGYISQKKGDIVTMPRNTVTDDPEIGCATGLHVGTWNYARDWGSVVYAVKVNPADVVSVPYECDSQKIRCQKYEVLEWVDKPYENLTFVNLENEEDTKVDENEEKDSCNCPACQLGYDTSKDVDHIVEDLLGEHRGPTHLHNAMLKYKNDSSYAPHKISDYVDKSNSELIDEIIHYIENEFL